MPAASAYPPVLKQNSLSLIVMTFGQMLEAK
jgi:hypothetical protein